MTDRQFLASEAWSTSGNLLQDDLSTRVASGVIGVAIRSAPMPGFQKYLWSLKPSLRPHDKLLKEFWENEFSCSPITALNSSRLPPCSGAETLEGVHHTLTDTSQLRVTYNVYLAVYAVAHALHNLLSCPDLHGNISDGSSNCSLPKHIHPREVNCSLKNAHFLSY